MNSPNVIIAQLLFWYIFREYNKSYPHQNFQRIPSKEFNPRSFSTRE